jgi:hypothetical protein
MLHDHRSPADLVRQSTEMARRCADTARLHQEPDVAARFDQLATEGEARARHLDDLARARQDTDEEIESRLIREHLKAVLALERQERRYRGGAVTDDAGPAGASLVS